MKYVDNASVVLSIWYIENIVGKNLWNGDKIFWIKMWYILMVNEK